jgi:glycosyltransferase involved in cell wall biosynthesis
MHLVIIIPAYNEAKVIGTVINGLPKTLKHITKITPLVIDDHSNDGTRPVAKAHGARCIRHSINLGAGGATITGLEAARRYNADIAVTMDADGQHDPKDIAKIIKPIINKEVEVVIGSRLKIPSREMPPYKRFGNWLLNFVTFIFFGIWVSDSQSGFKAFSRHALDSIKLSSNGYEFCSEIIGEIRDKKLTYAEVPIHVIYTEYSKSKGQPALNAINIFFGLLSRGIRS